MVSSTLLSLLSPHLLWPLHLLPLFTTVFPQFPLTSPKPPLLHPLLHLLLHPLLPPFSPMMPSFTTVLPPFSIELPPFSTMLPPFSTLHLLPAQFSVHPQLL